LKLSGTHKKTWLVTFGPRATSLRHVV